METIFYNLQNNTAYMPDQSEIANDNTPIFTYSIKKDLGIQLLNSDAVDLSGNFNDFYKGLDGVAIGSSAAVDDNSNHYFDGTLNAGISGTISTIPVKGITDTLREVGSAVVTNDSGDSETIYYNGAALATEIWTLTTASSGFTVGPITLDNSYAADDAVTVTDIPLIKTTTVDFTDQATGKLVYEVDANNVVLQKAIEGSADIDDCVMEFQVVNASNRRILIGKFDVQVLGILDDDSIQAPAPSGSFYDIPAIDAKLSAQDEFTELLDTPNSYVGMAGKTLQVTSGETALEFVTSTETDEHVLGSASDNSVSGAGYLLEKLNNDQFDELISGGMWQYVQLKDGGILNAQIGAAADIQLSKLEAQPDGITLSADPAVGKISVISLPSGYVADLTTEIQNNTFLNDLSGVIVQLAAEDNLLRYNGTDWVNVSTSTVLSDGLTKSLIENAFVGEAYNHTHDFDILNGIKTPTTEITKDLHNWLVVAHYDEVGSTKPDTVKALLHFSDTVGSETVTDTSNYARTFTKLQGGTASIISDGKFGRGMYLSGDGFSSSDTSGFALTTLMTMDGWYQPISGATETVMPLWQREDIIEPYIGLSGADSMYHVDISFDGEAEKVQLSYPVDLSDVSKYYHFMVQADATYVYVGFDGVLLDIYPRTGRAFNDLSASVFELGHTTQDAVDYYANGNYDEVCYSEDNRYTVDTDSMTYTIPTTDSYINRWYAPELSGSAGGGGGTWGSIIGTLSDQTDLWNVLTGISGDVVDNAADIVTNAADIITISGDVITNAADIAINTSNFEDLSGDWSYVDTAELVYSPTSGYTPTDTTVSGHLEGIATSLIASQTSVELMTACSNETSDLSVGTSKITFRMPYAMTLSEARANVNTAPGGSVITVDINLSGSSIFSTELTIDDGEKTSTTASTSAVISNPNLIDDGEITVDIDSIGSTTPGKGLKITLIGDRA